VKHARTDKERAEALAGRSFLYYSAKYKFGPDDSQHALEDISAAIELDPKGEYYFHRVGLQKDPNLALSDASKAIELKPENAWWYATRAHIREELKQPPQAAIDDLSTALAKTSPHNHNYPDYLSARAELFKQIGKLDAAEKDYAELIEYSPKSVSRRTDHLVILMALGRNKEAEVERKLIERIAPKALQNSSFVCKVADIRAKHADKPSAATPKDLTTAWKLGEIVALVPLQHLKGKPNANADKAWGSVSNLVRAGEKATGKEPHGLDPIPEFKGPKIAQVRQAIAFIFQQRKKVEAVLAAKVGERAGAVFAISSAGFMALGLNTMGVPNLNNQLGEIIEKEAPLTGLPCRIWVDTAIKATSHAKPADVVAAWNKTSKEAKTFLSKS
jgi:tetratricopeptide (TPR) repeat protein